ncbi:MAG TPA: hypothetical protein ENJ38_11365 [Rhodospirillales bacterium]|nr:hypothetical protein [Rhodospirillales bacterium]
MRAWSTGEGAVQMRDGTADELLEEVGRLRQLARVWREAAVGSETDRARREQMLRVAQAYGVAATELAALAETEGGA